jgi:two-component system phosphate regulon sensor histidine kinase PhoR
LGIAVTGYLAWHLFQLGQLERWLRAGNDPGSVPHVAGIWGTVFNRLHRRWTEQRAENSRLSTTVRRFQEATAAMPDATLVLQEDSSIEWFNQAATRLLAFQPEDSSQPVTNLIRDPKFVAYLGAADYRQPLEIPSPANRERTLLIHLIRYGDRRLLVARDISRLHALEQVRRDFVANVSHELRTPLTVISGFIETLQDDAGHGPLRPWASSLALMQQQAARMSRIVEDLLLLSRLESDPGSEDDREPVNIPSVLSTVYEDAVVFSGVLRHPIELEMEEDLWLLGLERELRSAFSNLVYNAVQYTAEDGVIRLRWFTNRAGQPVLEVQDDGIGIAAHHIPRLTERFYRVDVSRSRDSGGTGLGLAIVKHVLNRHGAHLEIESALGRGSTFRCVFPAESRIPAS